MNTLIYLVFGTSLLLVIFLILIILTISKSTPKNYENAQKKRNSMRKYKSSAQSYNTSILKKHISSGDFSE